MVYKVKQETLRVGLRSYTNPASSPAAATAPVLDREVGGLVTLVKHQTCMHAQKAGCELQIRDRGERFVNREVSAHPRGHGVFIHTCQGLLWGPRREGETQTCWVYNEPGEFHADS